MTAAEGADAIAAFNPLRPRLTRVAYRMLGSVAEAEDIVQEAFLRWLDADRDAVREPAAFLHRIVTRLCLDQLKSARRRRETYIGPWLPEPLVVMPEEGIDDVTLPLMMALERLSPLERAVFVLHDVFGIGFEEIAATIGRKPATCRQLASRARANVRSARPRHALPPEHGMQIASAFFAASRSGDIEALRALLTEDAAVYTDGGGKAVAPRRPVIGSDKVTKLFAALAPIFRAHMSRLLHYGLVNGLPGFVSIEEDRWLQTTALQIDGGRITAIYVTRNPEKLAHLKQNALH
ncbi:RNA polymerase sigma-70 factor (ECF subfamily) [Rhizobium sp. BK529]|uniref:sigma-70 family RNA polymerase sigma factor n=1 Tax=unclassified Rhizobium TaxID=2613769 RepID=UPI00104FAFA9|nr:MULTISPECIES: sigma-70 family RNA polymerase sigma factor [unclassified Rhizobium]MBB3592167.1 RNA polymerase sigma-70 factor (ECF subfamily) [Rhizobium sp. BK529]TCS06588.1 RNA polymerase sigma-70 factor (ECF subfamily) [Rhizobium sp. BK418]